MSIQRGFSRVGIGAAVLVAIGGMGPRAYIGRSLCLSQHASEADVIRDGTSAPTKGR